MNDQCRMKMNDRYRRRKVWGEVDLPTRRLAELIAENLFTNGSGDRAQRLLLMVDAPVKRDLGGWCFAAAVDRIAAQLCQARHKTAEATPKGSTAEDAEERGGE